MPGNPRLPWKQGTLLLTAPGIMSLDQSVLYGVNQDAGWKDAVFIIHSGYGSCPQDLETSVLESGSSLGSELTLTGS